MFLFFFPVALLATPPVYEIGVGVGAGAVADAPVALATPWAGASVGPFAAALHAPLRYDADADRLREADWDEPADYGRILRFARYGDDDASQVVRVGLLADRSLGHGTLVRRYHNGVDDDHHRTSFRGRYRARDARVEVFVDHLLGPPVVAARADFDVSPAWTLGVTMAADTAAPRAFDGHVDDAGQLVAETRFLPGYGADVRWAFLRRAWGELAVYGDVNRVSESDPGLHGGFDLTLRPTRDWRVALQTEVAWLGAGYDAAYFDTGYLVERWAPRAEITAALPAATGGRGALEVVYGDALHLGAELAAADGPTRADLEAWLLVPTRRLEVSAFYYRRARPPAKRIDVINPAGALAALALRVPLDPTWSLAGTLARVWRVRLDADQRGALAPGTEGAVMVEAAWSL